MYDWWKGSALLLEGGITVDTRASRRQGHRLHAREVARPSSSADALINHKAGPGASATMCVSLAAVEVAAEQQLFLFCHELVPLAGVRVHLGAKEVIPTPARASLYNNLEQQDKQELSWLSCFEPCRVWCTSR